MRRSTGSWRSGRRIGTSRSVVQNALVVLRGLGPWWAWALIGGLLLASMVIARAVGGAGVVAPHWFYGPIIVAAARFGVVGALPTAVAAGLLAGPGVPALVRTDAAQSLSDWSSRAVAFVVIGAVVALLVEDAASAAADELVQLRLEHELLEAINTDQLRLHFQPVVSLTSGAVVGVEALARWQHPARGLVPAGEFVPLAERSSLVFNLGSWVLDQACRQAAEWRRRAPGRAEGFFVAVNVSAVELGRAELVDEIVRVLGETGLDPSSLCLEVTETALCEDLEASVEGLLGLRMLGVHVAVDDFGTGYSSLVYLRRLPVDIVKIDRVFVQGMTDDEEDAAIVAAVVSLAHSLGKTALAEGVETEAQARALIAAGCDQAQGYHFGVPQPAEGIERLLRSRTTTSSPARDGRA